MAAVGTVGWALLFGVAGVVLVGLIVAIRARKRRGQPAQGGAERSEAETLDVSPPEQEED